MTKYGIFLSGKQIRAVLYALAHYEGTHPNSKLPLRRTYDEIAKVLMEAKKLEQPNKSETTELNLKDIGGGSVDVYYQCCSNYGSEVFMTVKDYDESRFSTAIMEPRHARKLAAMLLQAADGCEEENKE